jgi:hypothetical protein
MPLLYYMWPYILFPFTLHFISIKPVINLSYVTIFYCSLGRSHKTGLTVYMVLIFSKIIVMFYFNHNAFWRFRVTCMLTENLQHVKNIGFLMITLVKHKSLFCNVKFDYQCSIQIKAGWWWWWWLLFVLELCPLESVQW